MPKEIMWLLKEKYQGKPTLQFKRDIARLEKGEPLDYVIGFTEFLGCKIDLSKKPLIPRVETEFWVQKAIEEMPCNIYSRKHCKVLDMFAGSGCIGIAVLQHIKNVNVMFADSQRNSLDQIKINCQLNNINKKNYKIIQSDVLSNVRGTFDHIFANPPYIAETRKDKIQRSVLQYEPEKALFGGRDGFLHIKKFLSKAKNFLNRHGRIYIEFDPIQKNDIAALLKKNQYRQWEFFKDQYGKWRYIIIN